VAARVPIWWLPVLLVLRGGWGVGGDGGDGGDIHAADGLVSMTAAVRRGHRRSLGIRYSDPSPASSASSPPPAMGL
jgi:hypothetical protein